VSGYRRRREKKAGRVSSEKDSRPESARLSRAEWESHPLGGSSTQSAEPAFEDVLVRKSPGKRHSRLGTLIEMMLIVGAAFAIAMLVQTFVVEFTGVKQTSMMMTIVPGDRIIVNRLTYRFRDPKVGDVVVARDPTNDRKDIVKRIVAVAGDSVALTDGYLYVNGVVVDEPYVLERDTVRGQEELQIPEGYVYLMGDNRPASGDSREYGPVAVDRIVGRVVCIMWPIGRWRTL
jgi:signal peptidase I